VRGVYTPNDDELYGIKDLFFGKLNEIIIERSKNREIIIMGEQVEKIIIH
jgi:hypothetical protein